MESCVANPLNTLIKLFILPSNLISKRHDKLLDYDSAQSAYEKSKDQPSRQVETKAYRFPIRKFVFFRSQFKFSILLRKPTKH